MASPSSKRIFCYFHIGGQFVKNAEGVMQYEGGKVSARMIREGITYEELRRMVSTCMGCETNIVELKFTVKFDSSTLIDLVNDDGVAQLINYNDEYGHVYIIKNGNQMIEASMDYAEGIDACLGSLHDDSSSRQELELPCGLPSAPAPMPMLNSAKWKDLLVGIGQIFPHAVAFREALFKYSIAHHFGYKFVRNSPEKMIVKCGIDSCNWKITAYAIGKETSFLCVRSFNNKHIHDAQDNLIVAHNARSTLTSSIISDAVRSSVEKSANEIRLELHREYGLSLNYLQAYRGKEKALESIHGLPDQSYMLIPWICDRLMETDPNTIAKWTASRDNKFERLFIAYGCCINGFLLGARPILYIDGCHLSGPYKGTLLAASAYDADNELFPLAYAIVSGETFDEWAWFLQNIKEITRSVQIIIVSDRHNAIIGAVRAIFGGERHAFCYRHVKENFSSEFMKINRGKRRMSGSIKEDALKLLDAIAYARLECEFNIAMGNLRSFCPQLAQWLQTHGDIDRWALSRFSFRRWDNITTNLAESFNAWLAKERKHNVSVLIHEHREKLAKKMYNSKMAMSNWKNGVGPNVEAKLSENVMRAEVMHADHYGLNLILVRTGSTDLRVNLASRECTCQAWQMSGIPCPHACAAIKKVHGNVYTYVEECYMLSSQQKIYNNLMIPVETNDIPRPNALTITDYLSQTLLHPPSTSRPPGRPRTTRRESQFQNKKVYHCSRCQEAGHTRKTCRNPNPS